MKEGTSMSANDPWCPCCTVTPYATPMFCHYSRTMSMDVGYVNVWKMLDMRDITACSHESITYSGCEACLFMEELIENGQFANVQGTNMFRSEDCCDSCTYPMAPFVVGSKNYVVCASCYELSKCEHENIDHYENDRSELICIFCLDCGLGEDSILW